MTPIPATHADHDPLVIAAHAAGDAEGAELDTALALVAACPDCAALHHDLRAIASALPTLPDPVRSRDFRLSPGQAASLRPSAWRRLLAPLAGPRFAFAGPLGTGLATLGIAGFLVAGAVGMPIAGSAAAPGTPKATDDVAIRNGMPGGSEAPSSEGPRLEVPAAGAAVSMAPLAGASPDGSPEASSAVEALPTSGDVPGGGIGGPTGPDASGNVAAGLGSGAASPGPYTTTTGSGAWAPMTLASPGPEASLQFDLATLASQDADAAIAGPMDVPAPTVPATTPLVVLAAVMLAGGALLGGLRLLARTAA
jgi:hypothetical protein